MFSNDYDFFFRGARVDPFRCFQFGFRPGREKEHAPGTIFWLAALIVFCRVNLILAMGLADSGLALRRS